jgi:hypothetical protein
VPVIHDVRGAGPIYAAATANGGHRYFTDEFHHRVVIEEPGGYRWSFGELGSGVGEFRHPRGLALLQGATPEASRLFVCDAWNHRVEVFDGLGAFVTSFGGAGTGNGQFDVPSDIAVVRPEFPGEDLDADAADGAWLAVADRWNNRVQVFGLDGTYLGQVGGRASAVASVGMAAGREAGWPFFRLGVEPAMWFPVRVTWDAPALEVVSANGRVERVDLALALLPDFGAWRRSAGLPELLAAREEFSRAPAGARLVPDIVAAIDTDLGRHQLAAGQVGDAIRTWAAPWPVGLSPRAIERQLFERVGEAEAASTRPGGRALADRLLPDLLSRVALEQQRHARALVAQQLAVERAGSPPCGRWGGRPAALAAPGKAAHAPIAHLSSMRLRLARVLGDRPAQADVVWTVPPGEGDLQGPAVGQGRLAIVAATEPALWLFDPRGLPLGRFGLPGGTEPRGLAPAPGRGWFISDVTHDCVVQVSEDGKIVRRWGRRGEGPDGLKTPLGLASTARRVLVADRDNDRVREYDVRGVPCGDYAELSAPTALAADARSVWVAEWGRPGVRRLDRATGQVMAELRHADLVAPVGVALAGRRLVLVADYFGYVHAFTGAGRWLGSLGSASGQPLGRLGGLVVLGGHGLAVDHEHGQLLRFALPTGARSWRFEPA